ncbi:MAG: prenyltransferase/squalene oxidase repeat-containing protein [Verrucomicrobiota bacterium]
MSLRLEMLQVAKLSSKVLEESVSLVDNFLKNQFDASGGFKNREGKPDLYYTVFGVDALISIGSHLPEAKIKNYVESVQRKRDLAFIDYCCLARLCAALKISVSGILEGIETYRCPNGGYHPKKDSNRASAYGCFLAYGAFGDLQSEMVNERRLVDALLELKCPDGGFANECGMKEGATPATSAVLTLFRNMGVVKDQEATNWLLERVHPMGGFCASPRVPMPDLLSTAVALHALSGEQVSLNEIKEKCLDFVDSLWVNDGGFYGHWADEVIDAEYTFYGLLALGHLSL